MTETKSTQTDESGRNINPMLATGVHLFTFLDIIDCSLDLRRYANQDNRWMAQIERAELKDGSILSGNYGTGKTPDQAINDYIKQIKGKLIVINATSEKYRREYVVPTNIFYAGC
jgi:hypothetical protein